MNDSRHQLYGENPQSKFEELKPTSTFGAQNKRSSSSPDKQGERDLSNTDILIYQHQLN